MAYAAAVTTEIKTISGRRHYLISVTETEANNASEYEITGLPEAATLVLYRATLTAGTGLRLDPVGGNTTGFAENTNGYEFASSRGVFSEVVAARPLRLVGNKLVIRSKPADATADHAISTLITIVEGSL